MPFSDVDLAAIRSAIARGELIVEFADRKVTYRSIDDLLKAEARIIQALTDTGILPARAKQSFGVSSKGF